MTQSHWLDDLSKLTSSALGAAGDVGREARDHLRLQLEKMLLRMNLVSREEFEAVRLAATEARQQNAALEARIRALEAAVQGGNVKKSAAQSTSSKKPTGPA